MPLHMKQYETLQIYSNQLPLLRAFSRRIFLIVYTSEILKKSYRKEARRDMIQNIKCIEC